jgi:hypothetical protein
MSFVKISPLVPWEAPLPALKFGLGKNGDVSGVKEDPKLVQLGIRQ